MTRPNAFAAELLEASASAYAAGAASRLLADVPAIKARYGTGAAASWKTYYVQRLMELAAAVRVGAPAAFAARAVWQHKAFAARALDTADVAASLARLRSVLIEELPAEAGALCASYVDRASAALLMGIAPDSSELDPSDPSGALALKYLAACLEGDPRRAIALIVDAFKTTDSLERIYLDVIFPALREIGRMWHGAEATIAEERVVTETTRRLMCLLTSARARSADVGRTVVAAAVAGNAHDIGVRAVADFFEVAGWRSLCLGPDVPPAEIATAVQYFGADLVVLATTLTTQLRSLEQTIAAIRSGGGESVKILVGGSALTEAPELWRQLGADGYAAAADAVRAGSELVGLTPSA